MMSRALSVVVLAGLLGLAGCTGTDDADKDTTGEDIDTDATGGTDVDTEDTLETDTDTTGETDPLQPPTPDSSGFQDSAVDSFSGDSGDNCPLGETADCNGVCWPTEWIGDGFCDAGQTETWGNPDFDCAEFNFDEGDCDIVDPPDSGPPDDPCPGALEELDCDGVCANLSLLGDGICTDGSFVLPDGSAPNLFCLDYNFDNGDCDTAAPIDTSDSDSDTAPAVETADPGETGTADTGSVDTGDTAPDDTAPAETGADDTAPDDTSGVAPDTADSSSPDSDSDADSDSDSDTDTTPIP